MAKKDFVITESDLKRIIKEELKNANRAAQDIKNTVSGVQKSALQKFEGFKNSIFKQ